MAEVIGTIASIVTLLALTKSVATQIRTLRSLSSDSPLIASLSDEIDGTAIVLQELKLLLASQAETESFLKAWRQSNFDSVITKARANLDFLEAALQRVSFNKRDGSKNTWRRVRWLFDEKEISKHVENVQRQKLTLLLGLSSFILRLDVQRHEYSKTNYSVLNESIMATTELHLSVRGAHDILRQILATQSQLHKNQSSLQSMIMHHIGHHLREQSKFPQAENFANGKENSMSEDPEKLFKVFRARNIAGTLEIAYGSAAYFSPTRLCSPKGLGVRCNYIPPAWFVRMMISISFVIKILPRPGLDFGLHYVFEVPWEADVLRLAQVGDLDALKEILRSGRASATDRDLRGTTALHLAAYRRDVPMCRLLLSEGADPSAIMTYSNVQEMNVTPLRYLTLSASFRTIPHQLQQEMIHVLGTATLPKIELTEKSPVQLLFAANDVECDAGPLLEADLKLLDLNVRDNCGVTFLMMACEFGRVEAVKALICAGADVNVADKWGNTALHHASWSGYQDCIGELLAAGGDWRARNSASLGSQTPEDMAIWRGNASSWNIAFEKGRKRISEEGQRNQRGNEVSNPEEERIEGPTDLFADRPNEDLAVETAMKPQIFITQATQGVSPALNYKVQSVFAQKSPLSVALLVIIAFLLYSLI